MWRGRDRKKKSYFSLVLHMIHLTSKYFHSCEIQSQNPGRGTQVGRSIYIYNILSVSRKIDTLSFLTVWIQTFGWWICHFPSVPHIQYKFSVVFNKRDGEHFHSSPFLVQMPALSTVLAKKKKYPSNQTTHSITADHTYSATPGMRRSISILAARKPFFVSCAGMKEGHDTAAQHAKLNM